MVHAYSGLAQWLIRHLTDLSKTQRRVLGKLYISSLGIGSATLLDLADELGAEKADLDNMLSSFQKQGLLDATRGSYTLTAKGRKNIKVVMAGGAFDIIHPGHVETLEKSKALGDVLVISVARDITFEKNKHKKSLNSEEVRRRLVLAIKPVDGAVLGSTTDIFETIELLKPDIIALGYDQTHSESRISEEAKKRGVQVKVVRLSSTMPSIKSSKIIAEKQDSLRET